MKTKQWQQPMWILTAAVVLVGVFDLARPALAGPLDFLVSNLMGLLARFFGEALLVVVDYIITFAGFNNFIDAPVVQTGWVLTRDIANMFYVFVFLLIAFGTMLKSEEYNWKKLLPRLVLTALMVNFSRLIIGILIDFSQVVMLTFVNGFAATGGGNFLQALQIEKMFNLIQQSDKPADTAQNTAIGYLLAATLLGVALVVTAVFAVILLARIVALWVLIVLSPLAFLLGTFPKGKTYYDEWWKKLTNQIIVGPVLAFFLWLALATVGSGNAFEIFKESETYRASLEQNKATGASFPSIGDTQIGESVALGNYIVAIAILFAGLMVTQQLGVAGSGLAGGAASWMKSKATGIAKKAAIVAGVAAAPVLALQAGLGLGAAKLGKFGVKKGFGLVKDMAGEEWDIYKKKYQVAALKGEKPLLGRLVQGYMNHKVSAKARKEMAESAEKKTIEPRVAQHKDMAKAIGGEIFRSETDQVYEEQDKKLQGKLTADVMTTEDWEAKGEKFRKVIKSKDVSEKDKDKARAEYLQFMAASAEGHYFDDAAGSTVKDEEGNDVSTKSTKGKLLFMQQMGFTNDKHKAALERVTKKMSNGKYIDYMGLEKVLEVDKDTKKAIPIKEMTDAALKKQDFASSAFFTTAELTRQHADFFNGETDPELINKRRQMITRGDQRETAGVDSRRAGAMILGINNLSLSEQGQAWTKLRDESDGETLFITKEQLEAIMPDLLDPSQQIGSARVLDRLKIGGFKEEKMKIQIIEEVKSDGKFSSYKNVGKTIDGAEALKKSPYANEYQDKIATWEKRGKKEEGQTDDEKNHARVEKYAGQPKWSNEVEFIKMSNKPSNEFKGLDAKALESAVRFGAVMQTAVEKLEQALQTKGSALPSDKSTKLTGLLTDIRTILKANLKIKPDEKAEVVNKINTTMNEFQLAELIPKDTGSVAGEETE